MRFYLGTLDSDERSLPFGLLVSFPMEEIMPKQSLNTVLKTNTKKEDKNKLWHFSSMWHDHAIIHVENGAYLSKQTSDHSYGLYSVEISYFGSKYRMVRSFCHFLVFTKQLSKNLNVFFSCLIAADTCKNERNGPEIALTVLIFGHIYHPNILET